MGYSIPGLYIWIPFVIFENWWYFETRLSNFIWTIILKRIVVHLQHIYYEQIYLILTVELTLV